VDVAAALTARSYAVDVDVDVVIGVADGLCPWNAGRYRLSADGCERTQEAADLELDVSSLAAAYLGGTTLRSLAAASRVRELTPGAVARASAAFRGEIDPWCPDVF
jgi:predicted acetyltransferase